ncbi:hypothetical protein SPRG_14076 [Saprolegnia parasitica CBS 223.65]|uniref:RRM domain-containing protein n=1 Tax=Saprolegnia parasitica (strain CBS 223.65) TaxID=695850 RepID=A0A067BVI0_SAPPC|nr:hypothetical protein SPRG_14076 [Saprolegnia parasitica CBS 223.65]KDO20845.1 hypothetical protein SPRG_14076 [Saprolegnia parasitica CBS 223.65]|eukprot:XP_012208423.1 hypothetical protein SPRG_14076 [Saprolegnia parasitica CBS 223.65]
MGGKVFVRPVPDGVEDDELTAIFDGFGPIASMHIHTLKADLEPLVRHAYITYENDDDAESAARAMHQREIEGERVSVHVVAPRKTQRTANVIDGGAYYISLNNLPLSATTTKIKQFLHSAGITSKLVVLHRADLAYATLVSKADAETAVRALDCERIDGQRIYLEEVASIPRRPAMS